MGSAASDFDSRIRDLLPDLERVYTDIHAHPELSMQETRTAGIAADRLRAAGFEVTTGVGKTGVVGRAAQWRWPDGHAARGHGRAAGARRDRTPVREHGDGDRQHREERASHARLRPRHARDVADRRGDAAGADARDMERDTDAGVPARGGDRRGRPGDDRRRIDDALSQARRGARSARDGGAGRSDRRSDRRDHVGRRQPADPSVRTRRARVDAAGRHRSGGHGGGHRAPAADDRVP